MRRLVSTVLLAVAVPLAAAAPAAAGIWTPIASGTTQDISAVDTRGPGDILIATTGGKILRNGVEQLNAPGVQFTDIAFNPAGDRALATAANGKLYRFNGAAWSLVPLANTTFPHACGGVGPFPRNATPTGNLNAVTWAAANTAYVVGDDRGVVLKLVGAGPVSVSDVSRQANATCRVDPVSDRTTDIGAVTDQLIYLSTTNFGQRLITTDAFATAAAARNNSSVNCPGSPSRLAVDLTSANRSWVVGACGGSLSFGFSSDSGTTYDLSLVYPNGSASDIESLRGVAAAGGSAVAAGRRGDIIVTLGGETAYFQRADAPDALTDWLAVHKSSATDAVVAGAGGRLLASTRANEIPDLIAPAGTISGPAAATAGVPTTYMANVADNAGGSGINPSSFAWSATGVPAAGGNPVALTFPSPGFYTVRVAFTDNAGNAGTASLGVLVSSAGVPSPPGATPISAPSAPSAPRSPTKTKTVTVAGGRVTLAAPRACVPAGTSFTARLSFKRSKKKGTKFVKVTKVDFYIDRKKQGKTDRKAPFTKRLTVKRLKAGSTHRLRARATIKVKRGKGPTKSISTSFKVCG
ncbi:MAG: hypothetical protein H0V81_07045 [Solirubrobacterales bacterium]|nr:hypothetical protein [Solirubrobacterales bacterium]